jgi:hypothetical protein
LTNSKLVIYLYSSEIEEMKWLKSIDWINIKSFDEEKPIEYQLRYLQ